MKRKLLILLLAVCLCSLSSCGKPQVSEAESQTDEQMVAESSESEEITESVPVEASVNESENEESSSEAGDDVSASYSLLTRIDGSTSTVPLAVAACSEFLGVSREDVESTIQFNKTTTAYFNLLDDRADLLLIGEANEEILAYKEEINFEWEKTPFATDAFVFVVNENNPVDSITVEQARKIYSGEITNWKELGGNDLPITPLQRNSEAGSQTLMEKLVMQGTPMLEAPREYIVTTMLGLMDAVKSYDGSDGAIGYSVYYYAEEMKMAQGLKLLKLEGIEPNPENIRSETYPLINPKYVVIPAKLSADHPARKLFDWILSEEGQTVVAKEGYVSILDVGTFSKTAPTVGSRLREGYIDKLEPSDSYGDLIWYAGKRLYDDWPSDTGCMYGLMTRDGMVVTDAIYASVYTANCNYTLDHPFLVLQQGEVKDGLEEHCYAIAAHDGSWVTPFDYCTYTTNSEGLLLYTKDSLTLMDRNGTLSHPITYSDMGLTEEQWNGMLCELRESSMFGYRFNNLLPIEWLEQSTDNKDILCYDLIANKLVETSYRKLLDASEDSNGSSMEIPDFPIADAHYWTDILYYNAPNNHYLLHTYERINQKLKVSYYREDGTLLPELTLYGEEWYQQIFLIGGLIEFVDLNTVTIYDYDTMEVVFRTYLGYEAD